MKQERGNDQAIRRSPGAWGGPVKQEAGQKSPGNQWGGGADQPMSNDQNWGSSNERGGYSGGNDNWNAGGRSSPGGEGRGRGRGGGGNCFKCDEPGHFARECPNPDAGGGRGRGRGRGRGGGNRACFKCNEEGHMARECPDGDGGAMEQPAYKRQRRDDGGNSGANDGGNWGSGDAGANEGGWNGGGGATSGWGN